MSYAYDTIADIIRLAEENNISFGDVVLRYELENYGRNEEAVIREIEHRLDIFEMSIQDGIAYTDKTASGMSGGQAAQLDGQSPRFMSEIAYKAMTYAIAVNEANAKMFRIVACPTAGSCGVMPGAVKAVADHYQLDKSTVVKGFLAASGIGNVVANRACVAGAVGGCQAEIGTAACMYGCRGYRRNDGWYATSGRPCHCIVYEKLIRPCLRSCGGSRRGTMR